MQSAYEYVGAPSGASFTHSISSAQTVCRFWNTGCRAGTSCRFFHPKQEICAESDREHHFRNHKAAPLSSRFDPSQSEPTTSSNSFSACGADDSEELNPSSTGLLWDDPTHDVKVHTSSVRARGIVSLLPLQKPSKHCSQDIRSSAALNSNRDHHSDQKKAELPSSQLQSISSASLSRPQSKAYTSDKNERSHAIFPSVSSTRHLPQRRNVPRDSEGKSQVRLSPSFLYLQCELIDAPDLVNSLPVLASIRGCDLQYVRNQLSLCFVETYALLFQETAWTFLLPRGAVFSVGLEESSKRGTKLKSGTCRLFGKPLLPLKDAPKIPPSGTTLVLRTLSENALPVLSFVEEVLCVAFFERDVSPSQLSWNREQVPHITERLRGFLSGDKVIPEGFRALTPRCVENVLEADPETKKSTMVALGRLHEEPELPLRQPTVPSQTEQESETEEETQQIAVNGEMCYFPGFTLTLAQEHVEQQRMLANLFKNSALPHEPLVFRNHYTAMGPETCLQLGAAARVLQSSLLSSTAGCSHSAQVSEALSAHLLLQTYGLCLHLTEMELVYVRPSPKIDFTCTARCGTIVGVSVTRAFRGDESGKVRQFSPQTARSLIGKKLSGLTKAWESVKRDQQWQFGVLHAWVPSLRNATLVEVAFREYLASNSVRIPVVLLLTSTSFDCPLAFAYIYNHFS